MAEPLNRALLGLILLGVAGLAVQQWRLGSRIEALRTEVRRTSAPAPSSNLPLFSRGAAVDKSPVPKTKVKVRKLKGRQGNAEPDGGRLARRRERIKAKADMMKTEFSAFTEEYGIDVATGAMVLEELQLAKEAVALVRVDMHEGRISAADGRAEIQGVRIDTDAALVELLGDPTTEVLKERLADWLDKDDAP